MDAVIRYTFKKGETPETVLQELGLKTDEERKRVHFSGLMAMGRAKQLIEQDIFPEHSMDEPCLATSVVTVQSNGNVFSCCGDALYIRGDHALRLGNFKNTRLKQLIQQQKDNITIQAIRTIGPRRLAVVAGVISESREDEILALSSCGSCRLCLQSEKSCKATLMAAQLQAPRINALRLLLYGEV